MLDNSAEACKDGPNTVARRTDVGPNSTIWMRDKVRSAVRKAFTDTFTGILADPELVQEALSEPEVTKKKPTLFSAEVEDEVFEFLSDGIRGYRCSCGDNPGLHQNSTFTEPKIHAR
ncbi:hypothetical protein HDU97_010264 [Phlyctochytrium planicorne]|nr:hypothetical protein HDU97_010264 [Phlyctochytrium planicorne]